MLIVWASKQELDCFPLEIQALFIRVSNFPTQKAF